MKFSFFKSILWLSILTCLPLSSFGRVDWREDYVKALEEAKETSRPVFILFTNTESCPYCIESDRNIFSAIRFDKFSKDEVIPLKVDFAPLFETGDEVTGSDFTRLRAKYKIPKNFSGSGWPYIILVGPNGKILHQATERDITNARKFVEKYQDIIHQSIDP